MKERGRYWLRWLDFWGGIPLTMAAALYRRLERPRRPEPHPEKIGVICLGAIGDLLLASALTAGIRKIFPKAHLELIGSEANAAALPLNPHTDSCYASPVRDIFRTLRYLRSRKYDFLIDTSQWARLGSLLCNLSGAAWTAGFATRGQYRSAGYDTVCEHGNDCHELENFLRLGRCLWPQLDGSPELKGAKREPGKQDNIIYCHLWPARGKGRIFKQWPQGHWAQLITILLDNGWLIRLTGAPDDQAECEDFLAKYFPATANVESIAGEVTLADLASLFASAGAVISVNTGVMHLAAIAGAPTVGLHGSTNPGRWGPVGPRAISLLPRSGTCAYLNLGFEYPAGAQPAMENLPVTDVLDALAKLGVQPVRCFSLPGQR